MEKIVKDSFEDRLYYGLLSSEFDYQREPLNMDFVETDGIRLAVVRDDTFPVIGGGNKARKSIEYERFMQFEGYNAAVTCGGVQSNHNRAIALMCARNGWACHLCIQGTTERFHSEKGNALLDRLSGAECEFITPEQTSDAMDRAMDNFRKQGFKPLYITGGGHDLPGGIAYAKAVQQLCKRCQEESYKPKYIFLASGTGSTQAGILVGLHLVGWDDVNVIGISVARQYDRGRQVIADFTDMLAKHYGCNLDFTERIRFNTDYLCGGYEKFTPKMKSYLESVSPQTGLVFDTTYSGKAFYGMIDYVKKNNLKGNILFWHTGGLMNLIK